MINSVRNTVLAVLNKNNYGYISPSDFNQYALQAQLEIYEEYFSNYNKQIVLENARQSGTDYADMAKPIAEVMEYFLVDDFLHPVLFPGSYITNQYNTPSVLTTGSDFFMINKIVIYTSKIKTGTNTSTTANQLVASTADFTSVSIGDIVVNNTDNTSAIVVAKISSTALALSENIFTAIGKTYSIYDKTKTSEAERVSNGKIATLNSSILTTPDTMFPAYTLIGNSIFAYPDTISGYGALKAIYFRYPKPPKWTYISLSSGEPAFDQSAVGYQDFELPQEDEYKIATKILEYCGISIREAQVAQYAMAEEQKQNM